MPTSNASARPAAVRLRRERPARLDVGDPPDQAPAGRCCAHPGCRAHLSRYNPSPTCALHHGWADTRVRSYG